MKATAIVFSAIVLAGCAGPRSDIAALGPATDKHEDWWYERRAEKRAQIASLGGTVDLVFMGDSITHRWDRETSGLPSLDELRKTYSVLNLGYACDRTEDLLWRIENGELDGYEAKCIMLLIGTNNTMHRMDSPEDIAAGIRRILDVIAEKQPQAVTLLLPIFPFGASPDDPCRLNNEKANALIRDYADGKKVVWVDFNAKFLDEKGDTVAWFSDRVHPDGPAFKAIWLPSVRPYFKAVCGK